MRLIVEANYHLANTIVLIFMMNTISLRHVGLTKMFLFRPFTDFQDRIGTGLRANPVGGQGVIKLITQHVIGTNHP